MIAKTSYWFSIPQEIENYLLVFFFSKKSSNNNYMATKKVKVILKLNLKGGEANPAPPVGPALGQHGVNIMEFCKSYNEKTQDKKGQVIPAEVTIYEDRTFTFVTKLPPVSEMIKKALKLQKGAKTAGSETVATITPEQVEAIAREKLQDMNTTDLESAKRSVIGTARSMGIKQQ
jgi:large subunit ribosomal protein L11